MKSIFDLEFEDAAKAKKAAYTLSLAILLLSALELRSDEIDILGLIIAINKPKIILILKIALTVAALVLIIKLLNNALEYYKQYISTKIEIESEEDADELHNIESRGNEDDGMEPESYEAYFAERHVAREKLRRKTNTVTEKWKNILNVAIPNIALGILIVSALFIPNYISATISTFAK